MPTLTVNGGTDALWSACSRRLRSRSATAQRVVDGAVGQDDDELLAAVPGRDVARPDAVAEHPREQAEGPVAGLVAVGVVRGP